MAIPEGGLLQWLTYYTNNPVALPDTATLTAHLQSETESRRFELLWSVTSPQGCTAVHRAVVNDHVEIIQCILPLLKEENRFELLRKRNSWAFNAIEKANFYQRNHLIAEMLNSLHDDHQRELLLSSSTANPLNYRGDLSETPGQPNDSDVCRRNVKNLKQIVDILSRSNRALEETVGMLIMRLNKLEGEHWELKNYVDGIECKRKSVQTTDFSSSSDEEQTH